MNDLTSLIEKHESLEEERKKVLLKIQDFNHEARNYLLHNFPEALFISWSLVKHASRRER